jgi:hypothetical protein
VRLALRVRHSGPVVSPPDVAAAVAAEAPAALARYEAHEAPA